MPVSTMATIFFVLPVVTFQASGASRSASTLPPDWPVLLRAYLRAEAGIVGQDSDLGERRLSKTAGAEEMAILKLLHLQPCPEPSALMPMSHGSRPHGCCGNRRPFNAEARAVAPGAGRPGLVSCAARSISDCGYPN